VSAPLLVAYSVSGGSPPPTLESLRVFEDGTARAIVTAAWPRGEPQDEAGLYETRVDPEPLRRLVASLSPGEHGPVNADSGRSSIALGEDGGKVVWGAFTTPPPEAETLRAVLDEVRRHPVATVRLELDGSELVLSNPGGEPVGVSLVRPRVATFPGDGPPPLSVYRSATEVTAPPDGPLSAGERRAVPIDGPADTAFATLTLELPDSAPLQGFLVARRM
jgi:hypothetical protein